MLYDNIFMIEFIYFQIFSQLLSSTFFLYPDYILCEIYNYRLSDNMSQYFLCILYAMN